jgi:hypothetical protein
MSLGELPFFGFIPAFGFMPGDGSWIQISPVVVVLIVVLRWPSRS